ncbi:hypothetical protein [Natrinema sp. 1APR25-10V2]|uniref:hypothetical protein n=1 Tax=Natrinema sp. 1APR25-10V2 TaxID=2951081 RepID=UPI0028746508|nr:hypothetical protein [Natrinema sp. 1APR25-10V2]MDS0477798.1 hypothetical protein [Natrinema sp. 1APR25-10V2]
MTTYTYHDDSHPPPARGKTVLFCPDCGHEGTIADDWETETERGDRLLVCPVCGTVVDRRSRTGCDPVEAA